MSAAVHTNMCLKKIIQMKQCQKSKKSLTGRMFDYPAILNIPPNQIGFLAVEWNNSNRKYVKELMLFSNKH